MSKKLFLIFNLIILLLFVLVSFVLAAEETQEGKPLEIKYPEVSKEIKAPKTTEMKLEDYVKYIFALSIRIAGFIAFGVMVWGGIRYLTSAGSVAVMADSKKQILGGFLGIVILLSSYLILRTINPEIVSTKIEKEPTCDCEKICSFDYSRKEVVSCQGEKCKEYCETSLDPFSAPGVYLIGEGEIEKERVYLTESRANLTSLTNEVTKENINLNDKVKAIRFATENEGKKYCAILHEYENYEGPCRVFCEDTEGIYSVPGTDSMTGNLEKASSITIFQLDPTVEGEVSLYTALWHTMKNVSEKPWVYSASSGDDTKWSYSFPTGLSLDHNLYSLKTDGSFFVLLCGENYYDPRHKACLGFTKSHNDLTKTPMANCDPIFPEDLPLFVWFESCVESIAIYKILPIGYPL